MPVEYVRRPVERLDDPRLVTGASTGPRLTAVVRRPDGATLPPSS